MPMNNTPDSAELSAHSQRGAPRGGTRSRGYRGARSGPSKRPLAGPIPPPPQAEGPLRPRFLSTRTTELKTDLWKSPEFELDGGVLETLPQQEATVNTSGYVDILRDTYAELRVAGGEFAKNVSYETFQAYGFHVLAIWKLGANLRVPSFMPTEAELAVQRACLTLSYVLPSPLSAYLRALGDAESRSGEKFRLRFEHLPDQQVNAVSGLYGPIDVHNHNLYEEECVVGIANAAAGWSIDRAHVGALPIPGLAPAGLQLTVNCNGWDSLLPRSSTAAAFAAAMGFNPDGSIRGEIGHTGISPVFVHSFSTFISEHVSVMRLDDVELTRQPTTGAPATLLVSTPTDVAVEPINNNPQRYAMRSMRVTGLNKETNQQYALAQFAAFQVIKLADTPKQWAAAIPADPGHEVPAEWIANRHERRTIPGRYLEDVFHVGTAPRDTQVLRVVAAFRK